MPQNGCLRVLDPARGDAVTYSRQPDVLTNAIPLSDPSRIITDPEQPARPMFFSEPEHGWCYYFTHAELANQMGDYQRSVTLAEEAFAAGLEPEDPTEWLVFVEAYATSGDFVTAQELSRTALDADGRIRRGVCEVWAQIQTKSPEGGEKSAENVRLSFDCNP
jgi:hypothetical protein